MGEQADMNADSKTNREARERELKASRERTRKGWLVDRIEQNLDEVFKPVPPDPGNPFEPSELTKQRAYVAQSLERCARCGDHVAYLTPVGMSTFCVHCTDWIHTLEQPGLKWFREMVYLITKKKS